MFNVWNCHDFNFGAKMINIYDFDKTIYNGDSSIDFYKFCISKNKRCLLIIPKTAIQLFLYKIKIINKEKFKSTFFSFVKYFDNLEPLIEEFWDINIRKIKKFYMEKKQSTDYIISASPEFLLKTIALRLNFNLIATNVNIKTGEIIGKNCYGKEKVNRLKKLGISNCNEFYSDSKSDLPLRKIANRGYIVKKNKIVLWDVNKLQ